MGGRGRRAGGREAGPRAAGLRGGSQRRRARSVLRGVGAGGGPGPAVLGALKLRGSADGAPGLRRRQHGEEGPASGPPGGEEGGAGAAEGPVGRSPGARFRVGLQGGLTAAAGHGAQGPRGGCPAWASGSRRAGGRLPVGEGRVRREPLAQARGGGRAGGTVRGAGRAGRGEAPLQEARRRGPGPGGGLEAGSRRLGLRAPRGGPRARPPPALTCSTTSTSYEFPLLFWWPRNLEPL